MAKRKEVKRELYDVVLSVVLLMSGTSGIKEPESSGHAACVRSLLE